MNRFEESRSSSRRYQGFYRNRDEFYDIHPELLMHGNYYVGPDVGPDEGPYFVEDHWSDDGSWDDGNIYNSNFIPNYSVNDGMDDGNDSVEDNWGDDGDSDDNGNIYNSNSIPNSPVDDHLDDDDIPNNLGNVYDLPLPA